MTGAVTVLLAALLLLVAAPASAQPGRLDPSFDGDGIKVLDTLGLYAPRAVVVQPDGKLVVAANPTRGPGDFAIVRLLPDGGLDTGFDDDGAAYVDFGSGDFALAVALQPDGKVVVAGSTASDAAVARLHPNGVLDASFDGDGKRIIDMGGDDTARDVLVQPDGKIVMAGDGGSNTAVAVIRLEPDGALDLTFDGDGVTGVDAGGRDLGRAVALQGDGRIVAAGATSVNADVLVARFDSNGALDPTFGPAGAGWRTIDYAGADAATDVLVQPDGRLVIAGHGGLNTALAATRLHPDGSFDTSFDGDGTSGADFGTDIGGAALLQPDGAVVLVGSTSLNEDIAVARLGPAGALDSTFSADGKTTINLGDREYGYAAALQADGRIVITGDALDGALIARLQGDPRPGGGPGTDRPPRISRLSLRPSRFRARGRRSRMRIRFTLSERAAVTATIERVVAGRWVRGGRLRFSGHRGANVRRFSGRLARRPLRAGRHRLRLVAVDLAGQRSEPRVARFRVLRPLSRRRTRAASARPVCRRCAPATSGRTPRRTP